MKKDWKIVKIPEVLFFQEGPGVRKHQFTTEGVKLLNVGNINNGQINLNKTKIFISDKEAFGKYKHFLVNEGDLVIASSGIVVSNFYNKIAFIRKEHLPLCMNTSTIRFKVINKKLIDINYFKYFLKTNFFSSQLQKLITGSAQLNFGPSHLKKIDLVLPPLEDQKRIIKILDKADALRQKRKEATELLDDYLKSVFLEMFGDPVKNPKGWDKIFFGDNKYLKIIDGDRGKNYPKKDQFSPDGHCLFLSTSNVRKGSFDFSKLDFITKEKDESMGKGKVSRGDLILTTRGTLGNSAYYNDQVQYENIRINSGMVILRVNQNKLLPQYLIYVINSDDFIKKTKKANSGSAQPQLPIMVLSRLSFLVPTIVEQQKFIKIIQSQEYLKQSMLSQSAELETQFQALMQKAFKGEL